MPLSRGANTTLYLLYVLILCPRFEAQKKKKHSKYYPKLIHLHVFLWSNKKVLANYKSSRVITRARITKLRRYVRSNESRQNVCQLCTVVFCYNAKNKKKRFLKTDENISVTSNNNNNNNERKEDIT